MTGYQSVEEAVQFIFATDENGNHKHPFIGYDPDMTGDEEAKNLKCFICQDDAGSHIARDDEENKEIDEKEFINRLAISLKVDDDVEP